MTEVGDVATKVLALHGVQEEIKRLTEQRDWLIREIITAQNGKGVRTLSRYTGLSVAQVSRIWRRERGDA